MNAIASYLERRAITARHLASDLDYSPDQVRRMARGDIPTPRVVLLALAELERLPQSRRPPDKRREPRK